MKNKREIFIGTSGWMYKHWGQRFYPENLKEDCLTFFSREFDTVEINSSFYRMPTYHTFEMWREKSSSKFIFSVKLNQYLTHRKRLIIDEESQAYLKEFLVRAQELERKLAAILIQLPPSFKKNLPRLNIFLKTVNDIILNLEFKPKLAMEFRHQSWFEEEVYEELRSQKVSLVISSTPELRKDIVTADFVYIRMHGGEKHESKYLKKDLKKLKEEIELFPRNVKNIFVYFNNDYSAYAIENVRYLISLFESRK